VVAASLVVLGSPVGRSFGHGTQADNSFSPRSVSRNSAERGALDSRMLSGCASVYDGSIAVDLPVAPGLEPVLMLVLELVLKTVGFEQFLYYRHGKHHRMTVLNQSPA
jgi:hypothetical protein